MLRGSEVSKDSYHSPVKLISVAFLHVILTKMTCSIPFPPFLSFIFAATIQILDNTVIPLRNQREFCRNRYRNRLWAKQLDAVGQQYCIQRKSYYQSGLDWWQSLLPVWKCLGILRLQAAPCGRLSWLPVSFLLHVKHTLSYRMRIARSTCALLTIWLQVTLYRFIPRSWIGQGQDPASWVGQGSAVRVSASFIF